MKRKEKNSKNIIRKFPTRQKESLKIKHGREQKPEINKYKPNIINNKERSKKRKKEAKQKLFVYQRK